VFDEKFASLFDEIMDGYNGFLKEPKLFSYEFYHDHRLPTKISEVFLGTEFNVIIIGQSSAGIWHTEERRDAKYKLKKRLLNFVCSPDSLYHRTTLQTELINKVANKIYALLSKGNTCTITSRSGTSLTARLNSKAKMDRKYRPFVEVGPYDLEGSGGDYPFGEVGFGPDIKSVNGTIVFDYKIQHVGFMDIPLKVRVVEDAIVDLSSSDKRAEERMENLLARDSAFRFLCEVAVGLNPDVLDDPNISFVPEEKKASTVHFGFGGNYSYGDRKGPHYDGVIRSPTLTIDDKEVMKEGKFNSEICEIQDAKDICLLKSRNLIY
jgi:leucyl aminopeptidase (aminopeptidase T)